LSPQTKLRKGHEKGKEPEKDGNGGGTGKRLEREKQTGDSKAGKGGQNIIG